MNPKIADSAHFHISSTFSADMEGKHRSCSYQMCNHVAWLWTFVERFCYIIIIILFRVAVARRKPIGTKKSAQKQKKNRAKSFNCIFEYNIKMHMIRLAHFRCSIRAVSVEFDFSSLLAVRSPLSGDINMRYKLWNCKKKRIKNSKADPTSRFAIHNFSFSPLSHERVHRQ